MASRFAKKESAKSLCSIILMVVRKGIACLYQSQKKDERNSNYFLYFLSPTSLKEVLRDNAF